jgi:RHS repeat-associated protein
MVFVFAIRRVVFATLSFISFFFFFVSESYSDIAGLGNGKFDVDRTGAATYSLPIAIAPGTNGVLPEISLSYNSHGPDGLVGVGWKLSGLSTLQRCAVRRAGVYYSVNYDVNDRFCLDGALLVAEPGQTYGADGLVYRLEKQPWVRVTARGQCPADKAAGPCSFVVQRGNGDVWEYGTTASSAVEAIPDESALEDFPLGAIRTWAIARKTDRNFNYIEFTYQGSSGTGSVVPETIRYTGNATPGAAQAPQRAVSFEYEPVPARVLMQGGAGIETNQRLSRITSCISADPIERCTGLSGGPKEQVASYDLEYTFSSATERSLLSSVTQSGADGTTLRANEFDYSAAAQNAFAEPTSWTDQFTVDAGWNDTSTQQRQVADINGDGLYDLIGFGNTQTQFAFSTRENFTEARRQRIFSAEQGYNDNARFPRMMADFNGDGLADILGFGNSRVQVSLSDGERFSEPETWSREMTYGGGGWTNASNIRSVADINGDGRSDIIGFGNSTLVFQLSDGTSFRDAVTIRNYFTKTAGYNSPAEDPRYLADVNGDGRADIIGFKADGIVEVGLSQGDSFAPAEEWTRAFVSGSPSGWDITRNPRYVSDVNADGLADLVGFTDSAVIVSFATGKSFADPQEWTTSFTYNNGGWSNAGGTLRTLGDVNGDRLPDIIAFGRNATQFGINQSDHFDTTLFESIPEAFSYQSIGENPRFPADTIGAGVVSLIGLANKTVLVAQPSGIAPDLLTDITNDIGGTVQVEYGNTTDGSEGLYTPTTNDWYYPFRTTSIPTSIVTRHTLGNGLGATYGFDHAYSGAVVDLVERGFLGFETTTMTDIVIHDHAEQKQVATTTTYNLTFPLSGTQKTIEGKVVATGQTSQRMDFSYVAPEPVPGSFGVNIAQKRTTHHTLASSQTFESGSDYQYDRYGNLMLFTDLGNLADATDDSQICMNFQYEVQDWMLSLPNGSQTGTQCRITDGVCNCDAALTRDRWAYTDDGRYNTRSHGQFDDEHDGWLGSQYTYDTFGNVTFQERAVWDGVDATIASSTFDPVTTTLDPVYHSFQARVENALYGKSMSWDARFGVITETTEATGVMVRSDFDPFGRPLTLTGPGPQEGQTATLSRWGYQAHPTAGTITQQIQLADWSGETRTTHSYADGMGRGYRYDLQSTDGCVIRTTQIYAAPSLLYQMSEPFYASAGAEKCARAESPVYTTYRYNPLGQTQEVERPDGTITYFASDIAPLNGINWNRVTQTKAYGAPEAQSFTVYLDTAKAPLRWVYPMQAGATQAPVVDLRYDPLKRLVALDAPDGVFERTDYNSLGHTMRSENAVSGVTSYAYLPSGLPEFQQNANGQKMAWTYDEIGRVATQTTDGAEGDDAVLYTLSYDQSTLGTGRLTEVASHDGQVRQNFTYDPYGNRQQSKLTMDGTEYAILTEFDPMSRAALLVYPDGAQQKKDYTVEGFLSQVSVCADTESCARSEFETYVSYTDWTANGAPGGSQLNGGQAGTTTSGYDVMGRIEQYQTLSGSGTRLIEQAFDWSRLDQLLESTDLIDPNRTRRFAYDGAGYLTRYEMGEHRVSYSYDAIGNLKSRGDVTFQTDVTQVTSGTQNMEEVFAARYDLVGNMVERSKGAEGDGRRTWQQSYDALNRMVRIDGATGGDTPELLGAFTYDYSNRVVARQDTETASTSIYVSKNFDVTVSDTGGVVYTKYVDGLNAPVAAISTGADSVTDLVPTKTTSLWPMEEAIDDASLTLPSKRAGVFSPAFWGLTLIGMAITAIVALVTIFRTPVNVGQAAHRILTLVLCASLALGPVAGQAQDSEGLQPGANGPGLPVANQTLFFHNDLVRSAILVTDPNGEPQTEVLYGPYGNIDQSGSFGVDDFRAKFAGHEWSGSAELYLNAGRFYDPDIGKFVTADKVTMGTSTNTAVAFNRYAYGANNPVTFIDPTGTSASSILFDIGLAINAIESVFTLGGAALIGELGMYFGASSVNHSYDPAHWDYKSWKTYAGMAAGLAVSEIGLAISIVAPEAIPEEAGFLATFTAGLATEAVVGFTENATYAALAGGSAKEVLEQGLIGAAMGAGVSLVSQGVSAGLSRLASKALSRSVEAGEETASLGTHAGMVSEAKVGSSATESAGHAVSEEGCSFAHGTEILTPGGVVPIQDLRLGQMVMAADDASLEITPRAVTALYSRTAPETLILTFADGQEIELTANHPLLRADQKWVDAGDIRPGDAIASPAGPQEVVSVQAVETARVVFNITVDDLHTYIIGIDGIIVHNMGFCSWAARMLRRNMVKDGIKAPSFPNSAHHIVESGDQSTFMVKARDILKKFGVDVNDPANGVFLARNVKVQKTVTKGRWASAVPHTKVHTNAYKEYVFTSLLSAQDKAGVYDVLSKVRHELMTNTLPPKTVKWTPP